MIRDLTCIIFLKAMSNGQGIIKSFSFSFLIFGCFACFPHKLLHKLGFLWFVFSPKVIVFGRFVQINLDYL